ISEEIEAWDALDSMDFSNPSQGAHTSHLRTLSKIISLPDQRPTPLRPFVRGSRTLYIHLRERQQVEQSGN
ncbi:MAG: hypothetical protein ACYC9P_12745, partial [Rudaea sp.]